MSQGKRKEKWYKTLGKKKWKKKLQFKEWEENVGEMRPTGRKASLLLTQCLNLGDLKAPLLSPWSNNYSSLGTLISSAGPR